MSYNVLAKEVDQRLRVRLKDASEIDEPLSLRRWMRRKLLLDPELQLGNCGGDRQVGEANAISELVRRAEDLELDVSSRVDGRRLVGLLVGRLLRLLRR